MGDPSFDELESVAFQFTIPFATYVMDVDKSGVVQYFDVFGYGGTAHVEAVGEGIDGASFFPEHHEYLAAIGIGERVEGIDLIFLHLCIRLIFWRSVWA